VSRAGSFARAHWLALLAAASLAGLVIAVNPFRVVALFEGADRTDLLLMAPCVVAIYVFKGFGWWVTLRRIGLRIGPGRTLYVMFVGRTLIFVPTGDLIRIALLRDAGADGANAGEVAATIAFQELLYMGLVGLAVLPRIGDHPQLILLVVAMAAAHAGIFVILLWGRVYDWAVAFVQRVRVLRRFDSPLRSLHPAFTKLTTPGVVAPVLLWNSLAVISLLLLFHLSVTAVAGPHLTLAQTAFAYSLGHILGGLSFVPSGMGAMEAIVAGLMVTQGLAFDRGVAAVILFRAYNDLLGAFIGTLVGLGGRFVIARVSRVQTFSKSQNA
jgi:uncharacterized membrane protein YbhN (UPF0104 family)